MTSLSELVSIGKELGLSQEKLMEFIENQQELEEKKKLEEIEREEKKKLEEIEREEKKKQEEFEREERRLEREERAADRELQKLKTELELKLAEKREETRPRENSKSAAKVPKLPQFHDEKDSIDAYLERFERYAKAQEWKEQHWATNLSALLEGKALDVYYRMPKEKSEVYKELKTALLKRYKLTEDGIKEKFHTAVAETGETSQQFMSRLENYFDKWLEMAGVSPNYDEVRSLLIREQFITACNEGWQFI